MNKIFSLAAMCAASVVVPGTATAAVIFERATGATNIVVRVDGGRPDVASITDGITAPGTLSIVDAASRIGTSSTARAASSIIAEFTSSASATIAFDQATGYTGPGTAVAVAVGVLFYDFVLTTRSDIALTGTVATSGEDAVPLGQRIGITGSGGAALFDSGRIAGPFASTVTLGAGRYSMFVGDLTTNVVGNDPDDALGASTGKTLNSRYSIAVTDAATVPEPASWALMIAGFGMVGGAIRRRASVRIRGAAL